MLHSGDPAWPEPTPPPPAAPRRSRPHRAWYWFALGLVVAGFLACGYGYLFGTRVLETPAKTAPMGETLTVDVEAGTDMAVAVTMDHWVSPDALGGWFEPLVDCEVTNTASTFHWDPVTWLWTTGDGQYRMVFGFSVDKSGPQQLTCTSDYPNLESFGVTRWPSNAQIATGFATAVCCPPCSLLVATIFALVIIGKRRSGRRGAPHPAAP